MFLLNLVLTAVTVIAASRLLAGVGLKGYRAALKVAVVYAVLDVVGACALLLVPFFAVLPALLARPLTFLVVGIPALYATEMFVPEFEIADLATAAKLATLVVLVQSLVAFLLR